MLQFNVYIPSNYCRHRIKMKKIYVKYNTEYNENPVSITSRNFLRRRQNKVNQMNGLVEDFQLSYRRNMV